MLPASIFCVTLLKIALSYMYYSLNTVANFLQLIAMISITANLISAKGAYVIS